MPFVFSIKSLQFSDESQIELSEDDIVVLVGPNNAGKSAALREIITLIDSEEAKNDNCKVLRTLEVRISNEIKELEGWFADLEPMPNNPGHFSRMGSNFKASELITYRENTDWLRRVLPTSCTYLVNTENRLSVTNPIPSIDLLNQNKSHPFHYLYDDAELETDISAIFAKAFGTDLVVNRFAGAPIHLHIGPRPKSLSAFNVDKDFRAALAKLPVLNAQGDGMRAFVGCLMWATVVDYPIILMRRTRSIFAPTSSASFGAHNGQEETQR